MHTLARSAYLDAPCGVPQELPHAGSTLENPFVFDDAAKELKSMAEQGMLVILDEHMGGSAPEPLIDRLCFMRLR